MFYEFDQNNSGGYFHNNEVICPHMIFQCDSEEEAIKLAEDKGLYWDGVEKGIDCPCCGDRWYRYPQFIDLHKLRSEGYPVSRYQVGKNDEYTVSEWNRKYGKYNIIEQPTWEEGMFRVYKGKISFSDVEEYEQFWADEYCICNGDIFPAARIFYKDGSVKEIYRTKLEVE